MTNLLEGILRTIGALALLVLFALIVAQVLLRYGFGFTPFFTEEIARYALVWSVLSGTAVSILINAHIRVTFLPDMLGPFWGWFWMRMLDLISLVLLSILTFSAFQSVEYSQGQTSDGMQIPLQYPYFALPVAFGVGLVFLVVRIKRTWAERPWQSQL